MYHQQRGDSIPEFFAHIRMPLIFQDVINRKERDRITEHVESLSRPLILSHPYSKGKYVVLVASVNGA